MKDESRINKNKNEKLNYANSGKIVFTKEEENSTMLAKSPARFLLPFNSIKEDKKDRRFGISYTEKKNKDSNVNFDIIFEMDERLPDYDKKSVVLRDSYLPNRNINKNYNVNTVEFIRNQVKLFLKYDRDLLREDEDSKDEFIDEYLEIMDKFFGGGL